MGTTSCNNISVQKLKGELTEAWESDEGKSRPIAAAHIKGQYYVVKEITKKGEQPYRVIILTLLSGYGHSWSWKTMDEGMGPYYFDCPPLLLAIAAEPFNKWAKRWRENCRRVYLGLAEERELVEENMKQIRSGGW